jgi:hypothetical protein
MLKDGLNGSSNVLFYGSYGFPLEYFAELFVQKSLGFTSFLDIEHKQAISDQSIPYKTTDAYFIIDLKHPDMPKDLACFPDFVKNILQSSCLHMERHIFLLYNVDVICSSQNHFAMRVLLERFSTNAIFIGTTYRLGVIEAPIRSRFMLTRIPLPTSLECASIMNKPIADRNILHQVSDIPADLNFPQLRDFMKSTPSITLVRQMAYKLFQAHISLSLLADDLTKLVKPNKVSAFIKKATDIEKQYIKSSKCRETLYLELMLHYAFLL